MFRRLREALVMIRIEHSLFALPFALAGMFLAADGFPGWDVTGWILLAMIGARSAAMAFNRIADRKLDALNPRTRDRALPRGRLSVPFTAGFTVVMAALFFLSAAMLKPLCLYLSPIALLVLLGYSYTKRWTVGCHFVLGLSLAMAPAGAWLAAAPDPLPLDRLAVPALLSTAVLFWVAGFDVIYALLDVDFDRQAGLHSLPSRIGPLRALRWARFLHLLTVLSLGALPFVRPGTGWFLPAGCILIALLLAVEHALARPDHPGRINKAFFLVNAVIGLVLMASVIAEVGLIPGSP